MQLCILFLHFWKRSLPTAVWCCHGQTNAKSDVVWEANIWNL